MRKEPDFLTFAKDRVREQRISVKSLVVTVFGDTLSQHGNSVSLSSLIDVLGHLDIGERVVRTSVNRLLHEGLLQFQKIGRKSYYHFSETGQHHYEHADQRIYNPNDTDSSADWTLVIADSVPAERLRAFRQGLSWLGYKSLLPGLFACHTNTTADLDQMIEDLGIEPRLVVLTASINASVSRQAVKRLIYNSWKLEALAARYQKFCEDYRPVLQQLSSRAIDEEASFFLRTVLVHEYRRILLKGPELPASLLPVAWPGFAARDIAGRLYHLLAERSQAFIISHFTNAQGAVLGAQRAFYQRFARVEPEPEREAAEAGVPASAAIAAAAAERP